MSAPSIVHVREVHDQDGDLVFVLTVATHSRTAIDRMAETFAAEVRWIPDDPLASVAE